MEPILSRCGYRCDLCLAYAPNIQSHPENAQLLSDGWFYYFGFRIEPDDIYCDGCLAENARLLDTTCPVRPCVIARQLENCAQCADFYCAKLKERLVTLEEISAKHANPIPRQDYLRFIMPYENQLRLEALRNSRERESD